MSSCIEHKIKNIIRPRLIPSALRALHSKAKNVKTIENAIDLAFKFRHLGIRFTPSQVREEITPFLQLLQQRPPATVVEIGTEKGGTFFLLTRAATADALLLTLDLPAGQPGTYQKWRELLYWGFVRERQRIELVREDSHNPRTVEKVRRLLGGRGVDLLFIDGDHSYQGVKTDFELYSPLVSKNGAIAFHDIVPGAEASVGGVPRFWNELKQQHRFIEFVKDWKQGGWGIGVLPDTSFVRE
jgi:cephalosporin hydroxylase